MIQAYDLTRSFGNTLAVDRVTFHISTGVTALLGANGAGKTTTMRMLTGYLTPSAGRALICGEEISPDNHALRGKIGYLPENTPLYLDLVAYDHLMLAAGLKKIPAADRDRAVRHAAALTGISDRLGAVTGTLSKGFRQRLGLAMALTGDPQVLVLDEPSGGLDPNQIQEMRSLIMELGREKTVLISTHIMQEVEAACDRAVILHHGRVIKDAPVTELKEGGGLYIRTEPAVSQDALTRFGAVTLRGDGLFVACGAERHREVAQFLHQSGVLVLECTPEKAGLEDIFRTLTAQEAGE